MNRVDMVAMTPLCTYSLQDRLKMNASDMAQYLSQTESVLHNHAQMLALLQNRLNEIDQYCVWVAGTYPDIPKQYNALKDIGETA